MGYQLGKQLANIKCVFLQHIALSPTYSAIYNEHHQSYGKIFIL